MSRIFALPWSQILNKPSIGDLSGILPLDKLPAHTHSWADIPGLLPIEKLPLHNHDSSYYTKAQVDAAIGGIDLSSRVPYTGATGAVDLGSNALTAGSINLRTYLTRTDGRILVGADAGGDYIVAGNSLGMQNTLFIGGNHSTVRFQAGGSGEKMRLTGATGNLSIGTQVDNGADKLQVTGSASVTGNMTSGKVVTPTAWIGDSVRLYGSATGRMRVFNYAETTGVGLDIATDGTLKIMDKTFAGLANIEAKGGIFKQSNDGLPSLDIRGANAGWAGSIHFKDSSGTLYASWSPSINRTYVTSSGPLSFQNIAGTIGVLLDFSSDSVLKVRNRADTAYGTLQAETLLAGAGSAAACSVQVNGAGTGLHQPGVSSLGFSVAGARRAELWSDGSLYLVGTDPWFMINDTMLRRTASSTLGVYQSNGTTLGTFNTGVLGNPAGTLVLSPFDGKVVQSNMVVGFGSGLGGFISDALRGFVFSQYASNITNGFEFGLFRSGTNSAVLATTQGGTTKSALSVGEFATNRAAFGSYAPYVQCLNESGRSEVELQQGLTAGSGGTLTLRAGDVSNTGFVRMRYDAGYPKIESGAGMTISGSNGQIRLQSSYLDFLFAGVQVWAYSQNVNALCVQPYVASEKVLVAKGKTSQTGNLFETQNSSGQTLFNVGPTGVVKFTTATGGVYAEFNHGSTHTFYAGGDAFAVLTGDGTTRLYNNGALCWNTGATASSGAIDVRVKRSSTGTLRIEANNGLDVRNLAGTAQSYVVSGPRQSTVAPNTTDIASGACVWWHDSTANARRFAYNDTGSIYQSPLLKSSIPATPSDLAGVIAALQHWGLCA